MRMSTELDSKPTEHDRKSAKKARLAVQRLAKTRQDVDLNLPGESTIVTIPATAISLLGDILDELAKGHQVQVTPVGRMLTTQEAADILNVSRPFLVNLLEHGRIPYTKLGRHRRVAYQELMAFKERADAASEAAFRTLTEEAQELGLGY